MQAASWGRCACLFRPAPVFRNDLRPDITKAPWTLEEEYILAVAHSQLGNKWVHTHLCLGMSRPSQAMRVQLCARIRAFFRLTTQKRRVYVLHAGGLTSPSSCPGVRRTPSRTTGAWNSHPSRTAQKAHNHMLKQHSCVLVMLMLFGPCSLP